MIQSISMFFRLAVIIFSICCATISVSAAAAAAAIPDMSPACTGVVDNSAPCSDPWTAVEGVGPFAAAFCNSVNRKNMKLQVTAGAIPSWLVGTFYKNGIGKYSWGDDESDEEGDQVQHWFDGASQLVSISLGNGTATLDAKFVQTSTFLEMCAAGRYSLNGAFTFAYPGTINKRNRTMPIPGMRGVINDDVSLLHFGGKWLQTTDAPSYCEFSTPSLDVKTPDGFYFDDDLGKAPAQSGCTHGPVDDETSEYFNIVTLMKDTVFPGGNATIVFWKLNGTAARLSKTWQRTIIGNVSVRNAPYTHSLGITKRHVVWFENPCHFETILIPLGVPVMRTIVAGQAPTRIHAVDRNTGAHFSAPIAGSTSPSPSGGGVVNTFGFLAHTGNSFEDPTDGSIVYDGSRIIDQTVYKLFTTDALVRAQKSVSAPGVIVRCRLKPGAPEAVCYDIGHGNFPQFNKNFQGRPYRYLYTTEPGVISTKPPQSVESSGGEIRKRDLDRNATVAIFQNPTLWLTEALFVPRDTSQRARRAPDPATEDDGMLLTVAFHWPTRTTRLIGLHGANLTVAFEASMPKNIALPLHLHGIWCNQGAESSEGDRFCVYN